MEEAKKIVQKVLQELGEGESLQFGKKQGTPRHFFEECGNTRLRAYGTWKNIRNSGGKKIGEKTTAMHSGSHVGMLDAVDLSFGCPLGPTLREP